jgi:hypothetical protein
VSRSNHPRRAKNRRDRPSWCDGGWILETSKAQRVRLNREVDKLIKDLDYEVQLTLKGPKNAYDYP